MTKTIEVKEIAQYEETDSELAKYTIGKLTRENIALKEQLDMLVKDDEKQQKIIIDLQQRIDKAIEYIEKQKYYDDIDNCAEQYDLGTLEVYKLLDILRGKDNE